MSELWVTSSLKRQAVGEAIAYTIDYTDIGTPSAAGTVVCINSTGGDVSSTLLSGSAALNGNIVTLKLFTPSVAGYYRLINTVSISGNTVKGGIEVDVYNPIATQAISNVYATLAEFKHYAKLDQTDTIDDGVITDLIEGASRYIDAETGRTFYGRTETHYYDVPEARYLNMDDDLLSVTTLTNGDGTVIDSGDYYLWPRNKPPYWAVVMRESSSTYWTTSGDGDTEAVISVAGTWGYSTTAPSDVNIATLQIAHAAYKRRFGENVSSVATMTPAGVVVTPQDIPATAARTIGKYRRRL